MLTLGLVLLMLVPRNTSPKYLLNVLEMELSFGFGWITGLVTLFYELF